jgi:lysophospholipase L1-like esterase
MSRHVRVIVPALATALAVAGAAAPVAHAGNRSAPRVLPVVAGSTYLALGDSVAFGYREPTNVPTPDYTKPKTFVGYPEDIAANLGLHLTSLACPGETTASFLKTTAQSNGCENSWVNGAPVAAGYRTLYPLHTTYTGSQLKAAKAFLVAHPRTRLVTLTLGANDGFLCQEQSQDGCLSELKALLASITKNLETIYSGLRKTGYHGQIVTMAYYSLDYADSTLNEEINLVNSAIVAAGKNYNVAVAHSYATFKTAAAQANGDTCVAGLLTTVTTNGPCGVHPSVAGQALLAQTFERAIKKS